MDEPLPGNAEVTAWRPDIAGISEVFHATFVDYRYPPHSHDTWTVLIVEAGAISYDLDRRRCGAEGQTVAILPPGVTHDGRPASGAPGFSKRVLYLDRQFLPADLVGAAVDRTNIDDAELRATIAGLHRELALGPDRFTADSALALVAERIGAHLRPRAVPLQRRDLGVAARLRAMLDGAVGEPMSLSEAAVQLDRSKPHLIRAFKASYGLAPHAYLIGRRVELARKLLLDGMAPADVATAAGFYDQSHLNRHFKRHTAVPPSRYAAGPAFA